jgi:hypothetical protein
MSPNDTYGHQDAQPVQWHMVVSAALTDHQFL